MQVNTSPPDHVISKTKQYVAKYILLEFNFADVPKTAREFEVELLYFDMLSTK